MTFGMTNSAAMEYITAKRELEAARTKLAAAEQNLKLVFASNNVTFTVVSGIKVSLEEKSRASYDSELFALSCDDDKVRNLVLVPTVNGEMLMSALKMGLIDQSLVDAVTKKTAYTSIRLTDVAPAGAAK